MANLSSYMRHIKLQAILNLILLAYSMVGCKESEISDVKVMPNDFKEIEFSMSDIADDILIIPLSNAPPLYRFQKLIWHDSLFYYFSKDMIVRFTHRGEYVDYLQKQGRGPDEYLGIVDFFIDEASRYIYINASDRVQVYDRHLDYLRTIPYPYIRNGTVKTIWNNGSINFFYFNYDNSGYSWVKTDTLGNILARHPVVDSYSLPFRTDEIQIFTNNDTIYRFYNRNDTIFRIDNETFSPYIIINREFKDGYNIDKLSVKYTLESKKQFREIRSIFGLGDYWLINYSKKDFTTGWSSKNESVLYNPVLNESFLVGSSFSHDASQMGKQNSIGIDFSWVGYGYFLPFNVITIGSELYLSRVYDSSEYLSLIHDEDFQGIQPLRDDLRDKMIAVSKTISMEDNPVIVLIKLKKTFALRTSK
jgi:hypothetical protein